MNATIEADLDSAAHLDEPEPIPSNWEHSMWGVLLVAAVPITLICFVWMAMNMGCDPEQESCAFSFMGLNLWCGTELQDCAARAAAATWWRQAAGIMTVACVLLTALRVGSRHRAVFFTRWAPPRI